MFDINFISDPGFQTDNINDVWSFLHKRKKVNSIKEENKKIIKNNKYFSKIIFTLSLFFFIGAATFFLFQKSISPDFVLNQVVDLIIESGHSKNIKLDEAYFSNNSVQVTLKSDNLINLQKFTRGYRTEDNIPYQIFKKDNFSYLSLSFPWDLNNRKGDVEILKMLADKTIFSNKKSIEFTNNYFHLQGRSSDIISFLLKMAENSLIQHFTFYVQHLESGQFSLKINLG